MSKRFSVELGLYEKLAGMLFEAGVFLDKTRSEGGAGFRLKLHETEPSAPLSPVYLNLRLTRSHPEVQADVVGALIGLAGNQELDFERIADVPTTASYWVGIWSDRERIPIVTPTAPKSHGVPGSVVGKHNEGDRILLVDDLVTQAHSKLEAIRTLREAGMVVEGPGGPR